MLTKLEILQKLAKGEINEEVASQLLEQAELAKKPLSVKRTADGNAKISVYGLTRRGFPTTLWDGQWERVLDGVPACPPETVIGKIQGLIAERKAQEAAAAALKADAEAA